MKTNARQKAIKAELNRLNRLQQLYYPPAREYFFQCRNTLSKRQKRLGREFWAIARQEAAGS